MRTKPADAQSDRGAQGPESLGLPAPSITQPTGGGALRGIGEKFAANPVTGTGSMTLPIAAPAGRSGFGPTLALSYDSGAGNGPFGIGWNLSLPAITRKTDKGLPQYRDAEESDVFLLAGAEDLVPVRNPDGTVFEDQRDGHRIRRYRPRIDGAFARIERWTQLTTGETHWRSVTPDNVTTFYGKTSESRIADPADASRVFSWLICESYDDKGNAIVYEYAAETSDGVDLAQANERNRTDRSRGANRYLKRVKYGNRVSRLVDPNIAAAAWLFEVVFDYDENHVEAIPDGSDGIARLRASIEAGNAWSARPDAFSHHRAGFDVRTYRRCRRVLAFHRFEELGEEPCLVRSTDFEYADLDYSVPTSVETELAHKGSTRIASSLRSVSQSGYIRETTAAVVVNGATFLTYRYKSLPPIEFDYSQAIVQDTVEDVIDTDIDNLPIGLDETAYRWTDLDGEGVAGIVTEQAGAWYYKRNLSPAPDNTGARFASIETVARLPHPPNLSGSQQLMDLTGDGCIDVVDFEAPLPGYVERLPNDDWRPFRAFRSLPNIDWNGPNLRFIDLTGDGHLDVLVTENDVHTWYASLADEGFGPAEKIHTPLDEEKGPRVVFNDGTQSIYLADMSGDGLVDIVRIRNGEICYWPNLGYGRFGVKVTMDNAPHFDMPDQFDQRRVRLADIDGSGLVDVIYLNHDGIRLYFNQSGNRWSDACTLRTFPNVDDLSRVSVVDLLGNGTACLVWSSSLPGDARRPLRYVRLMQDKPHLLTQAINNLGAETRMRYAPSTQFYLQDKNAGRPWITRLPFPVHVVERVESYDHVSRNRFVTRYAYHHGYFDGVEREFRGFAMVEQWDTESFEDYVVGTVNFEGGQALAPELNQPPVLTRTWFHTGAYIDGAEMRNRLRAEYYQQTSHLPVDTLPEDLDATALRECVRALKGMPLRREVYGLDNSDQAAHPYSVAEYTYEVRQLQSRGEGRHAVLQVLERQSVTHHHERNPLDPRVAHQLNLAFDARGNVTRTATVLYGRQLTDNALPDEVTEDQQRQYITYREIDYTNDIDETAPSVTYRLGVPYETRSYEITGISPTGNLYQLTELTGLIAGTAPINYEAIASTTVAQKRLIAHLRTRFLDNDLDLLPLGEWDTLAIPGEHYRLAFTPSVVAAHYTGVIADADFTAAGYVHFDGDANWWIPSGTPIFPANPAAHFYLPSGTRDPSGIETIATYDAYDLLIERVQITQATWKQSSAVNDYRLLQPIITTDANGNRSAIEADELGMVVRSAIMGKVGSTDGDTLADPTQRMEYDLFRWMEQGQPAFVHSFARDQHGAANTAWRESYTYFNGGGAVALTKQQAHPGKALQVDEDGTATEVDADPRWVGNGRTVLNNKGNPVKQYEPYFSTTHEYESEQVVRELGVTPIWYYDAVGRNIRTLRPDGTLTRVEFTPWRQDTFDANDTVQDSEWYVDRGSPDPLVESEPLNNPPRRAAWLAAKHADTPAVTHFDSLGRAVYAESDHGNGVTSAVRGHSDLTGRYVQSFDQHQREVISGFAGMMGTAIVGTTAEKGRRWMFHNIYGAVVKIWDEHGRVLRNEFDALHRPVSSFVVEGDGDEILFQHVVYGDRHPTAQQHNLLGVPHLLFDQAGLVRVPELDFKGNPKSVDRILAREYETAIDWSLVAAQTAYANIDPAAQPALDTGEVHTASALYDALNRPRQVTLPEGTIVRSTYNEAGFLATLQAQIRGQGAFVEFLREQDYDAKGQRQYAHYGNDLLTQYFYDPKTFRLTQLLTAPADAADPLAAALQDVRYTHDPVGNVTEVRDEAQQTQYFNNAVVRPESRFEYDAIYQLIRATGRELAGTANDAIRTHADLSAIGQLPHANDTNAVRAYTEEYEYDLLGNIKVFRHRFSTQLGAGTGWTRRYRYAYEDDGANRTNRLSRTSQTGDPDAGPYSATYDYDAYGNMSRLPHLASLDWDFMDQLREVDLGGGGRAFYVYGVGGQRMRKIIHRNGNLKLEWIYLGPVMIHRRRRRDTNELRFERSTVHIQDNTGPIAQVDTKTRDDDNFDPANAMNVALVRYQYANLLGSATFETDADGNIISYEEYHPFGTSAYRSTAPGFDLSLKRFRYTGKERDDESGLYYFGARYYAPWLGRWTSTDPGGFRDGANLFAYARNNPTTLADPNGLETPTDRALREEWDRSLEHRAQAFREGDITISHGVVWGIYEHSTYGRVYVAVGPSMAPREMPDGSLDIGIIWTCGPVWSEETFRLWESQQAETPPDENAPEGGEVPVPTLRPEPAPDPLQSVEPPNASTDSSSTTSGDSSGAEPNMSSEEPESSGVFRPTGQSAVTTWDSVQRGRYVTENTRASQAAQEVIEAARREGDALRAWDTAEEVSRARDARRLATQRRLSPGGRAMSEAIDAGRSFDDLVSTYSQRLPSAEGGAPRSTRSAYEVARRVAVGAGESRASIKALAKVGRVAGPVGLAVGAGLGVHAYMEAPEDQKGRVAARETGSFVGGAIGASVGMSAGVALAGGISGLLIGLGVISGPIGWLAIGLGLLGAVAVGAWFSYRGGQAGEAIYDAAQ